MRESKTKNNIGKIKKLPNKALLIKDIKSAKEAARNKGLAKLGDEIINMCFSLARSLHTMECTGEKVSAYVLTEAMKLTGLRKLAKPRAKSHDIADSAEALIAYVYLGGKINLEEITELIYEGFDRGNPENTLGLSRQNKINAISNLMRSLVKLLENEPT
ncbi:MAG: ribonuclease III family protein [Promethearchaeota archaeon]